MKRQWRIGGLAAGLVALMAVGALVAQDQYCPDGRCELPRRYFAGQDPYEVPREQGDCPCGPACNCGPVGQGAPEPRPADEYRPRLGGRTVVRLRARRAVRGWRIGNGLRLRARVGWRSCR